MPTLTDKFIAAVNADPELTLDNVWPTVQQHRWKYANRSLPVNGHLWHFTGSGYMHYTPEVEYQAFLNWVTSPNNLIPGTNYAGISNIGTGPYRVALVVPLELMPRFSSHPSDEHAVSNEVGHPRSDKPWDPRVIHTAQKVGAILRDVCGIPMLRTYPYRDGIHDLNWRGETGHQDTNQGALSGKQDIGKTFWPLYLKPAPEPTPPTPDPEDPMTGEEKELLLLTAGLAFGWSNGQPFTSIEEAVARARELEAPQQDIRLMLGMQQLFRGLATVTAELREHIDANVADPSAITAKLAEIESQLAAASAALAPITDAEPPTG